MDWLLVVYWLLIAALNKRLLLIDYCSTNKLFNMDWLLVAYWLLQP